MCTCCCSVGHVTRLPLTPPSRPHRPKPRFLPEMTALPGAFCGACGLMGAAFTRGTPVRPRNRARDSNGRAPAPHTPPTSRKAVTPRTVKRTLRMHVRCISAALRIGAQGAHGSAHRALLASGACRGPGPGTRPAHTPDRRGRQLLPPRLSQQPLPLTPPAPVRPPHSERPRTGPRTAARTRRPPRAARCACPARRSCPPPSPGSDRRPGRWRGGGR